METTSAAAAGALAKSVSLTLHTHTHIPTNHTGASGKSEPASFESTLTDIFSSSSTAAQRVCWKVCDGHSHSLLFTFYFFHCEDTIPQGSQSQCVLSTLFPHSPENLFTLPCSESSSVSWAPLSLAHFSLHQVSEKSSSVFVLS